MQLPALTLLSQQVRSSWRTLELDPVPTLPGIHVALVPGTQDVFLIFVSCFNGAEDDHAQHDISRPALREG
jgi:hypothetical protein